MLIVAIFADFCRSWPILPFFAICRYYSDRQPCVAILTKPPSKLALRTKSDVLGVGAKLQEIDGGITVLHLGMEELSKATVDSNGNLMYGPHNITAVYSRYDFSHPTGSYISNVEVVFFS